MKKYLFISFSLILLLSAKSQPAYWQQEVNCRIDVTLNDTLHTLDGFVSMEYVNNSPDSLAFIYIHLWPNAYKNNQTGFAKQLLENGKDGFYFSSPDQRGYIDQLDFKVNGEPVRWEHEKNNIDIARVYLSAPLRSGERITLTTPFHVKIPHTFSRLGHASQSYQVTQWYPKPAVYDKNGWQPMRYLDQGEFYSEFGKFDVSITLPRNYVVAATGDLQNEDEIVWLNQKAAETDTIKKFSKSLAFPPSDKQIKTLRYVQSNVHDFAWFADKRYHVLKGETELPHSKRKVTSWVMFTNAQAGLWKNSIPYVNDAVHYYSLWLGDYPYSHASAVEGALEAGGGMEYPNVTVIGKMPTAYALERVIIHEVGHNWFYGILGSHERKHPWMDEGINSFYEKRYFDMKKRSLTAGDLGRRIPLPLKKTQEINEFELGYLFQASLKRDQAAGLPAAVYTPANYGISVYGKTALLFDYLKAFLGEEEFDKAMKTYYEAWKFKHPYPEDLRSVLETTTGRYLDWLFDDFIPTTKKPDYEIVKASRDTAMVGSSVYRKITVRNTDSVRAPYSISAYINDSTRHTIWYGGFIGEMEVLFPEGNYKYYRIDADEIIPEVNRKNNTLKTSGMFRHTEKLRLQPFLSLGNPMRTEITWSPLIGWNYYDKTMAGLAFYNGLAMPKKFEYVLAPMFGIGSMRPGGAGNLAFHRYTTGSKGLHQIDFSLAGSMFRYENVPFYLEFRKVTPSITLHYRESDPRSPVSRSLRLRGVFLSKDVAVWDTTVRRYVKRDTLHTVGELVYSYTNRRTIDPWGFNLAAQAGKGFMKTSAEVDYRITYVSKDKGLDVRLFLGTFFLSEMNDYYMDPRFRMGGITGGDDYLFDNYYLGRSEWDGAFSQQIAQRDGGFRVLTPVGSTDQWLAAANITAALPGKLPFKLFADIGTYAGAKDAFPGSKSIMFDIGLTFIFMKDIIEINFPFAYSSDIKQVYNLNIGEMNEFENYIQAITFTFNINKLNPFTQVRNVRL